MPRLATEGGILAAGALASTAWGVLRLGPGPQAQMMGFGSLVLGQLLHAFNRRDAGSTGSNPMFAATLATAFGAQAVALMVPGLRRLLGVIPLGPAELAVAIAGGVVPYVAIRMLRDQSSAAASATESATRSVTIST
jgi:Ca2+-transporting ATPase